MPMVNFSLSSAPATTFTVVFKLKNLPQFTLGQAQASLASAAGRQLDQALQQRIMPKNFPNLEYARVLDQQGNVAAELLIKKDAKGESVPVWLQWLNHH